MSGKFHEILAQTTFADDSADYKAFEENFKPKRTSDECWTPPEVYGAVLEWVCGEYGIDAERREIVRPFVPGGDYERFKYPVGCVVVDNPPFSILSKIIRFYLHYGIDFFLFAPTLTLFQSGRGEAKFIVVGADVVYANGAKVSTSFVTNMGPWKIQVRGDLQRKIHAAQKNAKDARHLPKYVYPPDVCNAAMLAKIAHAGGVWRVPEGDALFTRRLDAMAGTHADSGIYGGGFLLSKRAAMERAAMERAAMERAAAELAANAPTVWELSERERALQATLGKGAGNADA